MTKHNGLYKMKNGVIFIHIFTIPRPLHLFVLIHISILDHFIYTWSSAFSIVCNIVLLVMNFLIFCSLKMSLSLLWLLLSLSKNITRRQFFFQFLKKCWSIVCWLALFWWQISLFPYLCSFVYSVFFSQFLRHYPFCCFQLIYLWYALLLSLVLGLC